MVSEPTELRLVHQQDANVMLPYERLLGEAMEGDPRCSRARTASTRRGRSCSRSSGTSTPVHEYEPGSWGPVDADRLTAEVGGWHATIK